MADPEIPIRSAGVARSLLLQLFQPGPHVTYIVFLLIIGFFLIFAPNFATWGAAGAIGRITAVVTIMAVGMTFVIVCGEIDLSVGSHASFAAMIVAMLLYNDVLAGSRHQLFSCLAPRSVRLTVCWSPSCEYRHFWSRLAC